jgi:hypothetical protein
MQKIIKIFLWSVLVLAVATMILDIFTPEKQEVIVTDVWVMNVNIVEGTTLVAFQSATGGTPWSATLNGKFPELWQGEHVHVRFYKYHSQVTWEFDRKEFRQLP